MKLNSLGHKAGYMRCFADILVIYVSIYEPFGVHTKNSYALSFESRAAFL